MHSFHMSLEIVRPPNPDFASDAKVRFFAFLPLYFHFLPGINVPLSSYNPHFILRAFGDIVSALRFTITFIARRLVTDSFIQIFELRTLILRPFLVLRTFELLVLRTFELFIFRTFELFILRIR